MDAGTAPDLYVVTPFKVVQDRLRTVIRESGVLAHWTADPGSWVRERIGTVHTVQGREAEAVIFVLGGLQSSAFPVRQSAAERNQPLRAGQGYWLRRRDPRPAQILVAAADPARQVDQILEAAREVNGADR